MDFLLGCGNHFMPFSIYRPCKIVLLLYKLNDWGLICLVDSIMTEGLTPVISSSSFKNIWNESSPSRVL